MEYYIEFEKLIIHSMMILVVKSIIHLIQSHESTIFSGDCSYDLRWDKITQNRLSQRIDVLTGLHTRRY